MFDKIENEIKEHCERCPKREECQKWDCVIFRIKNIVTSIFDASKVNIDDFFETSIEDRQISFIDIQEE